MMLIIADENPEKAVDYLIEHTDRRFYFKQLIELGQLICSAGFSDAYEKVDRGKEIQEWIKKNSLWTYKFYAYLLEFCKNIFKNSEAYTRARKIQTDLLLSLDEKMSDKPTTAIFRYRKDYNSNYKTNSELSISIACKEYRDYIEKFKFKQ